MSSGKPKKNTRSKRGASLELPPNRWERTWLRFRSFDFLVRVSVCLLAAFVMWSFTGAWGPSMPYRSGAIPRRDIIFARVTFEKPDVVKTKEEKDRARRTVQCVYDHDPKPLEQLQQALKDRVFQVIRADNFQVLDRQVWDEFRPVVGSEGAPLTADRMEAEAEADFLRFSEALAQDAELANFAQAVNRAFADFLRIGLLENLQHELDQGSQTEITVEIPGQDKVFNHVQVADVRIGEAIGRFAARLQTELQSPIVAKHVLAWLKPRLKPTLAWNRDATRIAADLAAEQVGTVMITYDAGKDRLAKANEPLSRESIELLKMEHAAAAKERSWVASVAFACGQFGMYIAIYTLCGTYIYYRGNDLLTNVKKLSMLQLLFVAAVLAAWVAARDQWQAELIPLVVFSMTASIVYRQELALLLAAAVSLVMVLSLGFGLEDFVVWTASMAATVLLLRNVRSRTKLIYVGFWIGLVAGLTGLGVGMVSGTSLGTPILVMSLWYASFAIVAGIFMTAGLPLVEYLFDVQTEISLLELGDVAHPLLQELVRRAPGTYNHSINVASLAEAAADSIGGNGLLVRVGAYFHDIGKMLKPQYFIENQGGQGNRHEDLLPAMSTLIIIAHVKDGADLARQHHLPQAMVDFILQHHGTTLVEYFFKRASEQNEGDPDAGEVDEGSYRYPGPKPQTREAAVLLLADAVESASRTLHDPAPARIESLVEEIAMKRLMDGQFDECGITLQELRTVQDSLIKSLTATYHGRVKYPGQRTA